ncbi:beta-lactamase family protein [Beggiatoa alba]|nr:beta-lactamase family protein [Beggiatoa alba]
MIHSCAIEFNKTIESWQYFAPCLGANITIYDSINGYWSSASGLRAINPNQSLEPNELFYIYSITKTFTAIVVLKLVEKGLILLDDPINKVLTNLQIPAAVTIKRLLNHTSGVPSYTDLPDYMHATKENPSEPWSFEYVIERTCKGELDFEPGEKWYYSNTGYMLLLLMIESVTGESFAQNIDKFILQKIGLKNTYVAQDIDNGRLTNGYCRYLNNEEKNENITRHYNPWWCKTGLIVSTSLEVSKLYESLFNGKLVSSGSLSKMTKAIPIMQSADPRFNKPSYGFGLMMDPESDYGASYGHGGDGPGFNTWSVYYPDFNGRSVSVTVLCNTSMGGHPLYLVKDILRVLKNA